MVAQRCWQVVDPAAQLADESMALVIEPVLSRTSSKSAFCLVRLAVETPQLPPSASVGVAVVVSTPVLVPGFVPREIAGPVPRGLSLTLLVLPGIGVGPPQARNPAAVRAAAPRSHTQLVRLIIRCLVMLTSLKMRAGIRVSPRKTRSATPRTLMPPEGPPAVQLHIGV